MGLLLWIKRNFSNTCVTSSEGRSGAIAAYFSEKNTSGRARKAVENRDNLTFALLETCYLAKEIIGPSSAKIKLNYSFSL